MRRLIVLAVSVSVLLAWQAAAAPAVRVPAGVAPHHDPLEVAGLVRSKPWYYGRVRLHRVDEVLSVELRPDPGVPEHPWAVLVRGLAIFQPPLGGGASHWRFACVYLLPDTLELSWIRLVADPEPGQSLGFDACELK